MLTVFWDAKGVILTDFLTSGTINAASYCDTLTKLKSAIRRQRPGLLSSGFCSWTIKQDPTQQGTQKNAMGEIGSPGLQPRYYPIRLSPFSCNEVSIIGTPPKQ
ncbi:hypothetical protein AVEN_241831-1 [Araneus ventricosus]|uniref:Uncharacterized protein n=1 Tax=Araneus ventricosus TaxID=182803 RepID=A0A4Y2UWW5_ARAVE|nr:hypothetical protein AVEN_241831-1 [Araneus ventricosus]